jgi:hypothetical protein
MVETPYIFDEIFAIAQAMKAAHMRVLACFVAK